MAIVNITVTNDADFYRGFQYATVAGLPISIVGASLEMMLRRHAADSAVMLRLGSDTGEIALTDPVNGKFSVLIRQAVLESLGIGDYAHSNIMTKDGFKTRLWSGTFTNNPGATR